jgi:hypothetical protein
MIALVKSFIEIRYIRLICMDAGHRQNFEDNFSGSCQNVGTYSLASLRHTTAATHSTNCLHLCCSQLEFRE